MPILKRYRVVRRHTGDRTYLVGDVREARDSEVKHLVPKVLVPIDGAEGMEAKAEHEPLNKAEVAAPANKVARPRKSKGV